MAKDFKLELSNEEQMQEFCEHVAVAKLIADEVEENPSYEKLVRISDELCISVEEVQGYLRLYKFMCNEMIL